MQGVTPVPIPNTEVKPLQPMILLSGKVGYRRLYGPLQVLPGEAHFIFPTSSSCVFHLPGPLVSARSFLSACPSSPATVGEPFAKRGSLEQRRHTRLHHGLFPFDVHPRRHPGCVSDWMGTRSALDRDESKGGLIQGWADDS